MHCKTMIIDRRVAITGSVNMTHNGHENNKEHQLRITYPAVVHQLLDDFESDWEASSLVSLELAEAIREAASRKRDERVSERRRGNSILPKGVARNSDVEEVEC